jgi:hypothetical protein
MFSDVAVGAGDLARAVAFRDTALAPLGIGRASSNCETWAAWRRPGEAATLWAGRPRDGLPPGRSDGWMAAFAAPVARRRGRGPRRGAGRRRLDEGAPGPARVSALRLAAAVAAVSAACRHRGGSLSTRQRRARGTHARHARRHRPPRCRFRSSRRTRHQGSARAPRQGFGWRRHSRNGPERRDPPHREAGSPGGSLTSEGRRETSRAPPRAAQRPH